MYKGKRKVCYCKTTDEGATSFAATIHEAKMLKAEEFLFIKLKIAAQEVEETKYWLGL